MKSSLGYSLKVWLTTSVLTPFLVTLVMGFTERSQGLVEPLSDDITFFFACVAFGLGFSLIPFSIIAVVVNKLCLTNWTIKRIKIALTIIAISLITLLLGVFKFGVGWHRVFVYLPYVAVTTASIWYYNLNTLVNKDNAINRS